MVGEEAQRNLSPQLALNNFVAANKFAARFGWRGLWVFTIRGFGFPHRRTKSSNAESQKRL